MTTGAAHNTATAFGPSDASLTVAVDHLRSNFPDEIKAILDGRYACWLGSGISLFRFPGLKSLVLKLLDEVYDRCDFSNNTCPWTLCLTDILQLIHVNLDSTRTSAPPSSWTDIEDLLRRLVDCYCDALDQEVQDGTTLHSMTWDILHLDNVYGDDTIEPDADHTLLAVLLAEGAFDELVTTNWDGLIEKAHHQCCNGNGHKLAIVVETGDIPGSRDHGNARLTKIHGCACRCLGDPAKRSLMVATRRELQGWEQSQEREPIRELVRTILREKPSVFMGLSAQDWNLQSQILGACIDLAGPLPDVSKVLFAEPSLQPSQRTVLRHMIADQDYNRDRQKIETKAVLGLYSKPLLGALYLISLRAKVDLILAAGSSELTPKWQTFVEQAVENLEQDVCGYFDGLASPSDDNELWRQLALLVPAFISRTTRLFLKYELPTAQDEYYPLCPEPVTQLSRRLDGEEHPELTWFLFIIAAIHEGRRRGFWTILQAAGKGGDCGQFELELSGKQIAVFIVADYGTGKGKLIERSLMDPANYRESAVLYVSGRRPETPKHSPQHALPYTTTSSEPAEIWVQELAAIHPAPDALLDALKCELLCV